MDPSRAFVRDVKRVVIKVGTAVVTRPDGKLAVGRLGCLCEQVQALLSEQIDVIFVTSGAVGVGRQKLRHQHLLNSSFKDLHNDLHQLVLDGKACAAVGQSGLMALYESLFSQLGVEQAQLLVTDRDFKDVEFRHQLSSTVNALLAHRVVPIFNENDAISTRKAPYKDATGIFWDNDSLAALLALELKADLLILLSDVEGLYTGPPSDPQSQLIHTYLKEKHENTVTFGEKSRVGRGGMTAKVFAAWNAASAGIPVVITSGYATDGIERVMKGERVGTLFHNKAQDLVALKEAGARDMAVAARDASRRLQGLSSAERREILLNVAAALEANEEVIRRENEADVAAAIQARISQPLVDRLTIKPGKIRSLASSIRILAEMEEPLGQLLKQTEIAKDLVLQKTACPLGVVLVIFESRPDALVQIASLAIRSGNGLLLKGGKEAARSNAVLHKVITAAISEPVGPNLIGLVTSRDEIPDLLKLDDVIDLVIPRGSNQLVTQIKSLTKIPVLGHADGVCHVYLDKAINWAKAQQIVLDSKVDYPSACNAMETLLVHEELLESSGLQLLVVALQEKGVQIYGGKRAAEVMQLPLAADLHREYSSLACTLEIVENVEAAIKHIHENGSAHTDCVITEDPAVAATFLNGVDSAVVIHDASTRFCDGARFGLGAEVGISTSRIHARGPVGVEGLLTTRWLVKGSGQIVDGDRGVVYTHKDLGVKAASIGTANGTATGSANGKASVLCNGPSYVKSHVASNGNVFSNGVASAVQ